MDDKQMNTPTATAKEIAKALFAEAVSADDTQVAEFTFATASLALGDLETLELSIDAEPAYTRAQGLHFAMTLSASLCEPNSCRPVFAKKLSTSLGAAICKSRTPIADALGAHPALLSSTLRKIDAFGRLADAAALAIGEAKQIGESTPPRGKPSKASRI